MIVIRLSEPNWSEPLARYLEERGYIIEHQRDGFHVFPLGSLRHDLVAPQLAAHLQRWASAHPDAIVAIDGRPEAA